MHNHDENEYINEYGVKINAMLILQKVNIIGIAHKYKYCIPLDDAQQIVTLAILEAIPKVKNTGCHFSYLAWKGKCKLIDEVRKAITIEKMTHKEDIGEFAEILTDKKEVDIEGLDFVKKVLDDFKGTGRKEEILKLIIAGYDRDNCSNYIKEIADELGISTTAINLRLREIKKKISERLRKENFME